MTAKVVDKRKKSKSNYKDRFVPVEYDLNFGQIVREQIALSQKKQTLLAEHLGVSTTGLQHKLNNPTFGTLYDIIKVSLYLNVDLFAIIRNHLVGLKKTVFQGKEEQAVMAASELEEQYQILKKENELLRDLVKLQEKKKKM